MTNKVTFGHHVIRQWWRIAVPALSFLVASCSNGLAGVTCDDIEEEVVGLSEGALIKITDASEVSRTDQEVRCSGVGQFSDASSLITDYRAYIDEDQEVMVEYQAQ